MRVAVTVTVTCHLRFLTLGGDAAFASVTSVRSLCLSARVAKLMMKEALHSLIDADEVLEPYLVALKNVSNASTLRSLIMKILSDTNVFAGFSEIHSLVQSHLVGSADGEKFLHTLDLFSYGCLSDYVESPDHFIPLNEAQRLKLKQLTVLTIVERACTQKQCSIPYKAFQENVQLSGPNEVETLLVSCIYARTLMGTLCQKTQTLRLDSTHGPPVCSRDVPLSKVPEMLATIRAIQAAISDCQNGLGEQQASLRDEHAAQLRFYRQVEERMRHAESQCSRDFGGSGSGALAPLLQVPRRGSGWGAPGAAAAVVAGGDDPLDVAGPSAGRRQKRSRGGLSGVGDLVGGHRFSR